MAKATWTAENIGEALEEAISTGKILAYYQPKYDAITGKIVGAEALARWMGDDDKLISPIQFVPLLEKIMLITRLDWYILECTCVFQRQQLDDDIQPVPVSVNFSRMHTYEKNYVDKLCTIVDQFELPHRLIEVEITESALAETGTDIIQFIHAIREAGFDVAIDDFGSGLSSLSFVKDVPANILKIDKSLLSKNCEDEKECVILESIFSFAQRLKLLTVTEGVETKEQLSFLRTCGCNIVQGYYFAKPMKEEDYEKLLRNYDSKNPEDILMTQPTSRMTQLLLNDIFMCYPLVIICNLSKDNYYVMAYENFTNRSYSSTGVYHELIEHAAKTMHPDDQEKFMNTFLIQSQLDAYARGERARQVITRQRGDDGIYRPAEITNYFVKSSSSNDVFAVTLSKALSAEEQENMNF